MKSNLNTAISIAKSAGGQASAIWFGQPVPYSEAFQLQEDLARARANNETPDLVLFMEHPPVITLGNRGRLNHLIMPETELRRIGIELYKSSRGGDVTYHAPGQLVMYPIIKLGANEADAHGYLHNLEEIALRTAADFGVNAFRRDGLTGAWTNSGKLAAIGIRLRRWVTSHGMSFNVNLDLAGFKAIVPCGLVGEKVTSLRELLSSDCPNIEAVRKRMTKHFSDICRRPLTSIHLPAPII